MILRMTPKPVRWWMTFLVLVTLLGGATAANATRVRVATPQGWRAGGLGNQDALVQANTWAKASDYDLKSVTSTAEQDEYAELIAVFEMDRSLEQVVMSDISLSGKVLGDEVKKLLSIDAKPRSLEKLPIGESGIEVARGRWNQDGVAYDVVLGPAGQRSVLIVMTSRIRERSLYRAQFDEVVSRIEGLERGVTAFRMFRWRVASWVGWLLVAAAVYRLMLLSTSRGDDHRQGANRASAALVIMVLVVGTAVYMGLGKQISALHVAGVSRERVVSEVMGAGLVTAILVQVLSRFLGPEQVRSAPVQGAFALTNTRRVALKRELSNETRDPSTTLTGAPAPKPAVATSEVATRTPVKSDLNGPDQ